MPRFQYTCASLKRGQKVAKELKHTPSSEGSPFVVKPTLGSIELDLSPWLGRGGILLEELLFSNIFYISTWQGFSSLLLFARHSLRSYCVLTLFDPVKKRSNCYWKPVNLCWYLSAGLIVIFKPSDNRRDCPLPPWHHGHD
jgi:hypothetical protein